jgi:hypothetical protein
MSYWRRQIMSGDPKAHHHAVETMGSEAASVICEYYFATREECLGFAQELFGGGTRLIWVCYRDKAGDWHYTWQSPAAAEWWPGDMEPYTS